MRLRMILSFIAVALVSILSMVIVFRLSAEREIYAWMFRGGMHGVESLVTELEAFYRARHSWRGVEELFQFGGHGAGRGPGGMGRGMMGGGMMMNQRLRLASADGSILVDTGNPPALGKLSRDELQAAIPLAVEGETVGYLLPEGGLAFDLTSESALVERLNRSALISALISGGLALILALWLAYRLLRPVRELTRAAGELAAGNFSRRVPQRGHDEVAELGRAFNFMAASLEKAEASRRDMTADIAHELRTPLSVQRAHLEALQDGIYPLTPQSLDPILEQNRLLTRLVEDLRTLALADAGQLRLERVPTDLVALVKRVAGRFQPQADSRQIELALDLPANASLPAPMLDPARIEQVLANLLTNSLRHTPPGGRITLAILPPAWQPAHSRVASVSITVRDTGPGIPEEALPQIFERFYRADRSRSREEGGTGLGLAIARQIAQAHGGALEAANHPQGGAIFTLTLPLHGDS